jgi:hypothetical protein
MSRNSEERSVNNSQEKPSDPTPRSNPRINLLLSWFSTSREMEITYGYRHFHGTSVDSRTVSDVQVVECLINLLSKFMASLPSASSASPEQSSGTLAALADLCCDSYPHEIKNRDHLNKRN